MAGPKFSLRGLTATLVNPVADYVQRAITSTLQIFTRSWHAWGRLQSAYEYDTFDRADNAAALGTASSGSTYDMAQASTYTWSILSNHAEATGASAVGYAILGSPSVPDGEAWFKFQVSATPSTHGIVVRYTNTTN